MSAPHLTVEQTTAARETAERIGAIFLRARLAAGDDYTKAAKRLGVRRSTVLRFENGLEKNLKLGTIVRFLGAYGQKLAVVPDSLRATEWLEQLGRGDRRASASTLGEVA